MYTELFRLCGYEDDELEKDRPRIEKAFSILGIEKEDIARAEKRVQENFDIELEGVRKLLQVVMDQLISLPLCREEYSKVIYSDWPFPGAMMMGLDRMSKDIYVGFFGQTLNLGMGMIFGKLAPILEAGEKTGLPAGSAHCALWQTHVGAIAKGIIPLPDLIVSSGWYCDQPSEADQLLAELYNIPIVYMDGVLDGQWGEWPDISERLLRYDGSQMEKVYKKVEEATGFTLTEEAHKAGVIDNAKFYYNFNTIVEMVGDSDPQALSQADLSLIYWMSNTPSKKREKANNALITLIREVRGRVKKGEGVVAKGAPRIYFGLIFAVDPTILKMVESTGLAISVGFVNWLTDTERSKHKVTKRAEKIMEGYLKRGVLHSASGAIDYFIKYCERFRVDGAILCYPYSCRPYAISPLMAKKEIGKRLGIPVMVLEADCYDTRLYSAGQLKTKIETFADMLKMKKVD
jgi:hypothetical protein